MAVPLSRFERTLHTFPVNPGHLSAKLESPCLACSSLNTRNPKWPDGSHGFLFNGILPMSIGESALTLGLAPLTLKSPELQK